MPFKRGERAESMVGKKVRRCDLRGAECVKRKACKVKRDALCVNREEVQTGDFLLSRHFCLATFFSTVNNGE